MKNMQRECNQNDDKSDAEHANTTPAQHALNRFERGNIANHTAPYHVNGNDNQQSASNYSIHEHLLRTLVELRHRSNEIKLSHAAEGVVGSKLQVEL